MNKVVTDIGAVAELVASKQFPAAACKKFLTKYYGEKSASFVSLAQREELAKILAASKGGARDKHEQLCKLVNVSDDKHAVYALQGFMHVNPSTRTRKKNTGVWYATNAHDVLGVLAVTGRRSAWLPRVLAAFEWGDKEATAELVEQLGNDRVRASSIPWESTPKLETRMFAILTTSFDSDEARLVYAAGHPGAARAAVAHFKSAKLKLTKYDDDAESIMALATLIALAHDRFPQALGPVAAAVREVRYPYEREIFELVAKSKRTV